MSKIEGCPVDYVSALRAGALDREAVRGLRDDPSRPLLGFVRFFEWLSEPDVEESEELPELTQLAELAEVRLVPFAEDGTGQRWDFSCSADGTTEVVFVADQPVLVRAYAPTLSRFLVRLALESLVELDCEHAGQPLPVAALAELVRANVEATCRALDPADAEVLRAAVANDPVKLARGRKYERVSWLTEADVARLLAALQWPRLDAVVAGPLLG